ncbi:MAG TPA: hypothetical protein VIV11_17885 [Kofleriaceae bacterium]
MGRLDDIIDRNKHPARHRKMRFPVAIMLSAFVLLVLILMIFTDLGMTPTPAPPPPDPSDEKRVDGVLLYRAPAVRDAAASGSAGSAGSAATQPR